MFYIEIKDIDLIFNTIYKVLDNQEDKLPNYVKENIGLNELCNVLERVKIKYYPNLLDKAVYLLININKGHYFSNGNKRLSLVTTLFFLFLNEYKIHNYSKDKYKDKLKKIFPEHKNLKDYQEFNSLNFAYYNLTLIIAESNIYNISPDDLKERVKEFIKYSTYKKI